MKIAYLLIFHKDPVLLKRAIETLSSESCGFFIHIDQKSDIRKFSDISGENIFFSKERIPVHWGEFSQIDATMLLVRQALASSANYDYFIFLQGSTYPLRSGPYIQRFLEENRGWEFVDLVKMPAPGYPLSKVNTLAYPSHMPVRRFAARALAKMGLPLRDYRKHLRGMEPYAGHAWWALSRDACQYLAEFITSNPHVAKYFQKTFAPDESFFHTILGNSSLRPRFRRSFVYADWSTCDAHPAMLNEEHIRFFAAQEKVWVEDEWGPAEMLFARKFSDERLDLLQQVDEMIEREEKCRTSP
jgi:hypothetical protein